VNDSANPLARSAEISTAAAPAAERKNATRAIWMLSVLTLSGLVAYADRLILGVVVDPLRHDLRLTDSDVGILQGIAFTLVYVFACLPAGRLADRRARMPMLIGGATLWCCATFACAMATGFWSLFLGRMFIGVSESVLIPSAVSLIADCFTSARRGLAVGIFAMSTGLGGPLGITLGGALLQAADAGAFATVPWFGALSSWRIVLVSFALLGVVIPLLLLTIREPRRTQSLGDGDTRAAVQFFRSNARLIAPLYIAMALLSIGDYGLVAWVPTSLSRRFHWQASEFGAAFGVISSIAVIGGSLLGGWISDFGSRRAGARGRLKISVIWALLALAAALAISVDDPIWVLGGLGLWMIASVSAAIGALATLQALVPSEVRGTSVAILTFCNTLTGMGLGSSLVAAVTERVFGTPQSVGYAISAVAAPAALLACVLLILSARTHLRAAHSE
jgi:MFS family permease